MISKTLIAKTTGLVALAFVAAGGAMTAPTVAEAGPTKKFGVHIHLGTPYVHGGYGYHVHYGHRRCGWLHRRAVNTGSPYWWKRFKHCRYGHAW
jgi:hypothetical protein